VTVKVRKIRDGWGIVVHYRGRRKSKVIGSQARAQEVAERVRTALDPGQETGGGGSFGQDEE